MMRIIYWQKRSILSKMKRMVSSTFIPNQKVKTIGKGKLCQKLMENTPLSPVTTVDIQNIKRENSGITPKPCLDTSSSSESSETNPKEISTELIEFINRKKEMILKLVSHPLYDSELHSRSDRLMALQRTKSLRTFESYAIKDLDLIRDNIDFDFGSDLNSLEPYIQHIFTSILQKKKDPNPEDIFDHGGFELVPIRIKHFSNIFKTIEYVILPEVLTEFYMEKKNLSYKQASLFLYKADGFSDDTSSKIFDWSSV